MKVRPQWTLEDFRAFVRESVAEYRHMTASAVTLASFYVGEVIKPKDVTIKSFDWLRTVADKEIQLQKQRHK